MQPNTITLQVDVAADTVEVPTLFTRHEEFANRSTYITGNHTMLARDTLELYRTKPKASGNFRGSAKSSAKFTMDREVPGVDSSTTLTLPAILEVNFSIPVGCTPAMMVELRERGVALIDSAVTTDALMQQLEI